VSTANPSKYFTPSGRTLAWITKTHLRLYEWSGGRIGGALPQLSEGRSGSPLRLMRVLLLTTRGRKTGLPRTVPLPYFRLEGREVVVASFAGGEKNPAWYVNLCATPEVSVRMGRERFTARAVALSGETRERCWRLLVESWPRYATYQAKTDREIPLVELVRDL
jgi:deazaflavin-dependent oxidoreductase (nitroreductase family)